MDGFYGCLWRIASTSYTLGLVTDATRAHYEQSVRSWNRFRGMIREGTFLGPELSDEEASQALVEFIAWCCAVAGNQAGTISGKLAAVQYFHRVDHGRELPINSPLVKRATSGYSRASARGHASSYPSPCVVGFPVEWARVGRFLGHRWTGVVAILGVIVSPACPFGRNVASASGDVHPVHCLTRDDVAFYDGDEELPFGKWHLATRGSRVH